MCGGHEDRVVGSHGMRAMWNVRVTGREGQQPVHAQLGRADQDEDLDGAALPSGQRAGEPGHQQDEQHHLGQVGQLSVCSGVRGHGKCTCRQPCCPAAQQPHGAAGWGQRDHHVIDPI
jgi:hypothetical protein